MGKHAAGSVVPRHQGAASAPASGLTDAQVDAELERQAVAALRKRVREDHCDDAIACLGDLMRDSKYDYVRRGAAKDLIEIGYGKVADTPQAVAPAQSGPRIVVNVLRLSGPNAGEHEPVAVDVRSAVEEAEDALSDEGVQQALSFTEETP